MFLGPLAGKGRTRGGFTDRAGGLAVYWRAGNALAGEGQAAREEKGDSGAVVEAKYERVLGRPLDFEEGSDGSKHVYHLQHYGHFLPWPPGVESLGCSTFFRAAGVPTRGDVKCRNE